MLFLSTQYFYAQDNTTIAFARHLYTSKDYEALKTYGSQLLYTSDSIWIDRQSRDTLGILVSLAKLKIHAFDSTAFIAPSDTSLNAFKVNRFLRWISNTVNIDSSHTPTCNMDSSTQFIITAIDLLKAHKFDKLDLHIKSLPTLKSIHYQHVLFNCLEICDIQRKYRRRSPLKSALLSAILPGIGKKYAGYRGEAVSNILTNGILAIVTAEAIWRKGLRHPYTWITGGLFTSFYFSNIIGSYYAVKRKNIQHQRTIDDKINQTLFVWLDSVEL